ncbi:MAG: tRNA uridine-5-carboxymethylaminomethyl(34) synthesis enzyme MnmG, partial [Candidatus Omnitrophica bacterium]|nr:tRNA uridine-5-carboxymethylaminomethyl(34) synthesis enzyme MnmG [Candidatus Omnitrophota bacterium]
MTNKIYDVIVIGAGHAGCEAALASARMGCSTLMITLHLDKIGWMSCNPAVGGIGKGQLVKELDALGGEMGRATDNCCIQFRTLNASKGAAVWSSRAQVDRKRYARYMCRVVSRQRNLKILTGEVTNLLVKNGAVYAVKFAGEGELLARTVIITPGTFLNGLMHIGMRSFPGGRLEEQTASSQLSSCLSALGFRTFRFKTGTCARLDKGTINFSRMCRQNGDEPPRPFSLSTKRLKLKQVPCYITYTEEKTHQIIRRNLKRSPLFSGKITGTGVRYCPSFEDKVVKFPHHPRHQVFLEPEGLDTDEYYPNGLSTSLPEDVQDEFIHSVAGLEKVRINRFGYGIEHDVVDSTQLYPTLETKLVKNLYLAGQINGTTGYEEAAAQGLLAGINAALRVQAKAPFILQRSTSYIGVLIDDLITKGTLEPYRMFTSRVEYRLLLREDNADLRLRKFGYELGLVGKKDYQKTQEKKSQIQAGLKYLNKEKALSKLLKRPGVQIEDLKQSFPFPAAQDALKGIEMEVKYSGFIQRQLTEVRNFQHLEKIKLPTELDYEHVPGLSREVKEKLFKFRPLSLGQANRISGITPTAITILQVYLRRNQEKKQDRYYKFSNYLKKRFGCRVHKVSVDAGFSCPNRDGKISKAGCIFCDNRGFNYHSRMLPRPLEEQIQSGIEAGRSRFKAEKFMVYFQAYTNTYAPLKTLKERYDLIRRFEDIVAIAIGTRPDCVNNKVL